MLLLYPWLIWFPHPRNGMSALDAAASGEIEAESMQASEPLPTDIISGAFYNMTT